MKIVLPTRDDLISKIESLMHNTETREAVAAWAMAVIDDDAIDVTDARVWEVLKNLGGADLLCNDRPYLYTNEDFAEWVIELK